MHAVAIIIPTLARAERGAELFRAAESVLGQTGVRAVPIIAINGDTRDPALVARLRADSRLRIVEREDASIPGALQAGHTLVDTPWFGALDDDDILLPGALAARVSALLERPECDAVVSNGFRRNGTGDVLHIQDPDAVRRDPLGELLRSNWLLPGSWLCRSAAAAPDFFAAMPRFLECTYVAVRLASAGRLLVLDAPSVIWHTGRADSESNSRHHRLGEAAALQGILGLPLPAGFRSQLTRRLTLVRNHIAEIHLSEGNTREAWRWHLTSLGGPGGLRNLPYTARLIAALWRR